MKRGDGVRFAWRETWKNEAIRWLFSFVFRNPLCQLMDCPCFRRNERHKSASSAPFRLIVERPFIKSDSSPVHSVRQPNKLNKLSAEIRDYFVWFGLEFYQSIGHWSGLHTCSRVWEEGTKNWAAKSRKSVAWVSAISQHRRRFSGNLRPDERPRIQVKPKNASDRNLKLKS